MWLILGSLAGLVGAVFLMGAVVQIIIWWFEPEGADSVWLLVHNALEQGGQDSASVSCLVQALWS